VTSPRLHSPIPAPGYVDRLLRANGRSVDPAPILHLLVIGIATLAWSASFLTLGGCTATRSSVCPQGFDTDQDSVSSNQQCASVLSTRGTGLVIGQTHFTLGWMKETVVTLPSRACHVVIMVEKRRDIEQVIDAVKAAGATLNDLCIIKEG